MLRRLFFFLFLSLPLLANVTVDLESPTIEGGTLTTTKGGVLTGDGIRIQARCITYTRSEGVARLVAEGDLMVERECDILTGCRLEYDFLSETGCLYEGRVATGPWYLGASLIHILPRGCYIAERAYLTTCEGKAPEWGLYAQKVSVNRSGEISATNVQGRIGKIPFLWLPSFTVNTNNFVDSPLRFRAEVAGIFGSRIGIRYRFLTLGDLKAFARLEYIIGRGPAGGIETEWCPSNRQGSSYTQSYVARDRSIEDPTLRTRYRFAGNYQECFTSGYWTNLFYDALSDREMPSDYRLNDFNLHTARTSQFDGGRTTPYWTGAIRARPRLNTFQLVSQELPNVDMASLPLSLPYGIIGITRASAGYWETLLAKQSFSTPLPGFFPHNFRSSRIGLSQTLARPICTRALTLLPELRLLGLHYGEGENTLQMTPDPRPLGSQWLGWVWADLEASTRLTRFWGPCKHALEPYARATAAIQPTSRNDAHPIFSSRDAYTDLRYVRFGLRQEVYYKQSSDCLYHPLSLDLFTYAFIDTPAIVGQIPRLYGRLTLAPTRSLEAIVDAAWNLSHNQIDHFNGHLEWTLSERLAFNVELRYRSPYAWRKADPLNFTLDTFTPESLLLHSPLSDQRYTILTHSFFRLLPTLGIELETRHGFRVRVADQRPPKPNYNEGKLSFYLLLPCRWQANLYYEHTEVDERVALGLTLGPARRPRCLGRGCSVW
ncbi:MAG: hypothetical protein AB7F31_01405 [Parachlamydiales bacterium]